MTQQTGVAAMRKAVPDAKIYTELTHTAQTWKFGGKGYDDHCWRRSTKEMLENTAKIAYARGADGVSFFNFAYYRAHGGFWSRKGPFTEPPFAYLTPLVDQAALAKANGYFYLAVKDELFPKGNAKRPEYKMDIVPAKGNGEAVLRLLLLSNTEKAFSEVEPPEKIARGHWEVKLNGETLTQIDGPQKAYPYETPIQAGFGKPEQYVAFAVPAGVLKDGENTVQVGNIDGPSLRLRWIEIAQPAL